MKKIESLIKALEVESKKWKREVATRDKNLTSIKTDEQKPVRTVNSPKRYDLRTVQLEEKLTNFFLIIIRAGCSLIIIWPTLVSGLQKHLEDSVEHSLKKWCVTYWSLETYLIPLCILLSYHNNPCSMDLFVNSVWPF